MYLLKWSMKWKLNLTYCRFYLWINWFIVIWLKQIFPTDFSPWIILYCQQVRVWYRKCSLDLILEMTVCSQMITIVCKTPPIPICSTSTCLCLSSVNNTRQTLSLSLIKDLLLANVNLDQNQACGAAIMGFVSPPSTIVFNCCSNLPIQKIWCTGM